jgi:hypothetical protein
MRPKTRLPVFWLGVAAASLALVCLLLNGQPHAVPRADTPPPEHVFPPTFVHAVPEVGFMSTVPESGPFLRAAVAAWPGDSGLPLPF